MISMEINTRPAHRITNIVFVVVLGVVTNAAIIAASADATVAREQRTGVTIGCRRGELVR